MEKSQDRTELKEVTTTAVSKPKSSEKPSAMDVYVKQSLHCVGDRVSE